MSVGMAPFLTPNHVGLCHIGCVGALQCPGAVGRVQGPRTAQVSLTMMISIGMGIRIFFMYLRLSSLTMIRSTALTKA